MISKQGCTICMCKKKGPCAPVVSNQLQVDNRGCMPDHNDWEDGWKTPAEQMGHPKDEEEQDKGDEELDEGQGNDQNNGAGNTPGPSTKEAKTVPTTGVK
jgi:hypothetical protein